MGELEELRNRVDQAVERLSAANDARRHQSQSLMTRLTDLEEQNEALARENADLAGLVNRLVQIVGDTASSEETYTLFRGSAKVSDGVANWLSSENSDTPEADASDGREPDGREPDGREPDDGMEIPL